MSLNQALQASECKQFSAQKLRLETTSTVVEVLRSPFRYLLSRPIHQTLTQMMSNSRRSPSLIPDSVGVDHPCCRKPHGSLRSFSLTGTILSTRFPVTLLVFNRAANHLLCGFYLNFLLNACFKSLQANLRWLVPRLWRHTLRLLVMLVVFRYLLKIFEYAAKQACKQM